MPEIKKFLVLSTGHLKNETANWLNQVILEDARFISGLSDERIENSPVVAGYAEFGYSFIATRKLKIVTGLRTWWRSCKMPASREQNICCSTATSSTLRSWSHERKSA
jgi:hypothetical protein